MAVPTITTVSPNSGPSGGGQIAEITGTNFRTRTVVAEQPEGEYPDSTVIVTVNGRACEKVEVVSATLIRVRIPTFLGDPATVTAAHAFPPVAIAITNIDDDGDAIVGETVTAATAYTYTLPPMRKPADDPPHLRVLVAFIRKLKREVIERIAEGTSVDFGEVGDEAVALSEHPSIGLRAELRPDVEWQYYDNEPILAKNGSYWERYPIAKTSQIVIQMTLSAGRQREAYHLVDALYDSVMSAPWLTLAADISGDPANNYPIEFVEEPGLIGSVNKTDITAFSCVLRIRGIQVLYGKIDTKYKEIATFKLYAGKMDENNFEYVTF